jgi:hypothetical protein
MRRSEAAVAVAIITSLGVLPPVATGQHSNFGQVQLRNGFRPDPKVVEGRSGGSHPASEKASNCRGYISRNPDYIVRVRGNIPFLRVFVESERDTTLVIQGPRDQVVCNDDTYGTNPSIEDRFRPGTYRIWVGSYTLGDQAPYELVLTSNRNVTPGHRDGSGGVAQLDVSGTQSNYDDTWLESGFDPDPQKLTGRLGGELNASGVGPGCRGWITPQPDHIVNLEGRFGFFRIFGQSPSDTTLVVRAPDGTLHCNDDTNGLNPAVSFDNPSAGMYLVWVGSYNRGDNGEYSVGLTENRSTTAFAN